MSEHPSFLQRNKFAVAGGTVLLVAIVSISAYLIATRSENAQSLPSDKTPPSKNTTPGTNSSLLGGTDQTGLEGTKSSGESTLATGDKFSAKISVVGTESKKQSPSALPKKRICDKENDDAKKNEKVVEVSVPKTKSLSSTSITSSPATITSSSKPSSVPKLEDLSSIKQEEFAKIAKGMKELEETVKASDAINEELVPKIQALMDALPQELFDAIYNDSGSTAPTTSDAQAQQETSSTSKTSESSGNEALRKLAEKESDKVAQARRELAEVVKSSDPVLNELEEKNKKLMDSLPQDIFDDIKSE